MEVDQKKPFNLKSSHSSRLSGCAKVRRPAKVNGSPNNTRMVYSCHLCDAVSTSAVQLNFHLQKFHHLFSCNDCKLLFSTKEFLYQHEVDSHPGQYTCEFCGKILETRRKYSGHKKNHRNKCSSCYYCGLRVASKDEMMSHVTARHPEREFTCSLCDFKPTFPSRSDLLAHLRDCETDPLQCKVCKQFFQSTEELLKHMDYHIKKQLYYHCDICGQTSIAALLLQRHLRETHGCNITDTLVETFAMTLPELEQRKLEGYQPEEAIKRMTDFMLMAKRVSISVKRTTKDNDSDSDNPAAEAKKPKIEIFPIH